MVTYSSHSGFSCGRERLGMDSAVERRVQCPPSPPVAHLSHLRVLTNGSWPPPSLGSEPAAVLAWLVWGGSAGSDSLTPGVLGNASQPGGQSLPCPHLLGQVPFSLLSGSASHNTSLFEKRLFYLRKISLCEGTDVSRKEHYHWSQEDPQFYPNSAIHFPHGLE